MANDPDLNPDQMRVKFKTTRKFVDTPTVTGATFVFETNEEGGTGYISLDGVFTDGNHISGTVQYRSNIGDSYKSGTFTMERQP